jgi:hypothetical protein
VNDEAQDKLRRVQQEHQKVIHEQQQRYFAMKEQEKESYYNDLERQYNQIDSRALDNSYNRVPEQASLNSQNLSFLNGTGNKQFYMPMPADSRQSHMSGERNRRNLSNNTIQMLNDNDYYEPRELGMDMLNVTNYSTILQQEQNPEKVRAFYKQFTNGLKNNKRKNERGEEEDNLVDLLCDLRMIA